MRKVIATATLGLFLASGFMATPAQAAYNKKIVNGVSCKKLNSTTKGKGNETYKCVKNPYYKKTTLTWTWAECLNAQKSLLGFKKAHNDMITLGASAMDVMSDQDFIDGWTDATKDACARGV